MEGQRALGAGGLYLCPQLPLDIGAELSGRQACMGPWVGGGAMPASEISAGVSWGIHGGRGGEGEWGGEGTTSSPLAMMTGTPYCAAVAAAS